MRKLVMAAAILAVGVPTIAQAMTVAEFLAKTEALQAKSVFAIGSPDIALLRGEIMKASDAYRAKIDAEVAAGRKPSSCPPPKGTAKVTSDDIIAEFKTIPAAKRGTTSVSTAFAAFMTRRYPCKG